MLSPLSGFGNNQPSITIQSPDEDQGGIRRPAATTLFSPTESKELLLGQESSFIRQKRTSTTTMT